MTTAVYLNAKDPSTAPGQGERHAAYARRAGHHSHPTTRTWPLATASTTALAHHWPGWKAASVLGTLPVVMH